MPSSIRHPTRVTLAICLLMVAGAIGVGRGPLARAASTGQLQQRISAGQQRVTGLSSAVRAASRKVSRLSTSVFVLQSQITRIQADLDAQRLQLLKLRDELTAARTRLSELESFEARAESVLSRQLIAGYENDRPDIVSVVLESTGFNALLERLAFAQRIRNQDTRIVGYVKAARRAVAAQATRLGTLSQRQQRLTVQVLYERNRLNATKLVLVGQQIAAAKVQATRAGQLASARGDLASLRGQLASLQAAQAQAQARAAALASASSGSGSSGTGASTGSSGTGPSGGSAPASSSGGFTFPLPKADVSPPGTWSLDDGVDMSAPGGAPEYAVCSGTVVLHGIGGFGPSAPVLHCDSPLAGYDYVYYGHAGPGNWIAVGTHVSAGEVISEIGYGIVGISTGPHIEMGFADSSGSPIGPSSAPQMMSLLQAAYAG